MQRKVKLNGRKLVFRFMHIELGLCDIIQAINGCPCIELGLCDIIQAINGCPCIELGMCDIIQPKNGCPPLLSTNHYTNI